MSLIVRSTTRLVAGFIAIFGVFTVFYGHVSPGGGFAGGVIVAGAMVLIVLAFGEEFSRKVLPHGAAAASDALGALGFLMVALFGYMAGGFFVNFLPRGEPGTLFSAGTIPISNLAIGIKVAAGLFGAFLALAIFRRQGEGMGSGLLVASKEKGSGPFSKRPEKAPDPSQRREKAPDPNGDES
jgi:multicomponent Na+:H+ antiporter subunit B